MAVARTNRSVWMNTKACPRCGYRGQDIQSLDDSEVFDCPGCGEDLYARPPMSYAQREGFAEPPQDASQCELRTQSEDYATAGPVVRESACVVRFGVHNGRPTRIGLAAAWIVGSLACVCERIVRRVQRVGGALRAGVGIGGRPPVRRR